MSASELEELDSAHESSLLMSLRESDDDCSVDQYPKWKETVYNEDFREYKKGCTEYY